MKILIAGKGLLDKNDLPLNAEYIDMSYGYEVDELMDLYEKIKPELCDSLRKAVTKGQYDRIVGLGESMEYKWNATVIARLFGQFTSWHGQWKNPYGKNTLTINGKKTDIYAIRDLNDYNLYVESVNNE